VMGRRAVPLFCLCPGIRLTTEEEHGIPQSGQAEETEIVGRF
jgi:hypothetical protein